jgi:hypothetical protein
VRRTQSVALDLAHDIGLGTSPIARAEGDFGRLARPVSDQPFRRLGVDPLARFCFGFEITNVLRQHRGARQAHIPAASVLPFDGVECLFGSAFGHGRHYGRGQWIAPPEDSSATFKAAHGQSSVPLKMRRERTRIRN